MKPIKLCIALVSILACSLLTAELSPVLPYLPIRSQGLNTPRHLVGVIQQLYTRNYDSLLGTVNANIFYTRSFDNDTISKCLFGLKECETIGISGSRVENPGPCDWLADYFYLPTDFKSSISFKPKIDNIGAEFSFFIALDEWTPGLYFAVYAPLVHSRWDLGMCETIEMKGTSSHVPGYFAPDTLQRNDLLNNFTQYVGGKVPTPVKQTVAGTDYTTVFQGLANARISTKRLNQTRLADIRAVVGYDFVRKDRFRLALQGLITGPAGNRPEGEFLFDPVIGNGHHWELGASIMGNYILWRSQDEEKQIIFTEDFSITHLFASRQKRTFDLAGKPFSRYMLLERMGTPIENNLKGDGTAPSQQFKTEFLPVANLSKLCVDVSATIQAEITAMFTFVCDNFSWDIGYNFWGRSCENLKLRGVNPFENNNKWALKGDAHVFGYDRGAAGTGPLIGAVPLSATQSNATITSGLNFTENFTDAQALLNPAIDNPKDSTGDGTGGSNNHSLSADPDNTALVIKTSINPIFPGGDAINICERRSSALSSTLFTHFSYAWKERKEWVPYLGIGGQVEFSHNSSFDCKDKCDECISCAISQWGIWVKGGMTF